jgi:hypothetical protein
VFKDKWFMDVARVQMHDISSVSVSELCSQLEQLAKRSVPREIEAWPRDMVTRYFPRVDETHVDSQPENMSLLLIMAADSSARQVMEHLKPLFQQVLEHATRHRLRIIVLLKDTPSVTRTLFPATLETTKGVSVLNAPVDASSDSASISLKLLTMITGMESGPVAVPELIQPLQDTDGAGNALKPTLSSSSNGSDYSVSSSGSSSLSALSSSSSASSSSSIGSSSSVTGMGDSIAVTVRGKIGNTSVVFQRSFSSSSTIQSVCDAVEQEYSTGHRVSGVVRLKLRRAGASDQVESLMSTSPSVSSPMSSRLPASQSLQQLALLNGTHVLDFKIL